MFLPDRVPGIVVVAVALAKTTILKHPLVSACTVHEGGDKQLTCLPLLVRPRASRRLCTEFTIQLILGSRRIWRKQTLIENQDVILLTKTYSLVAGVNQNDLVVLVHSILVNPVRV